MRVKHVGLLPVIPALGKLRQKNNHEFKGSLLMIPSYLYRDSKPGKRGGRVPTGILYRDTFWLWFCLSLVPAWHTILYKDLSNSREYTASVGLEVY